MKKFLAILLAMMLVMVSVAAMAADGDPTGDPPPTPTSADTPEPVDYTKGTEYELAATAEQTIVLPKVYTVTLPNDMVAAKNLPSDTVVLTQTAKKVENTTTVTTAPDLKSISSVVIKETGEGANAGPDKGGKYSYDVSIGLPSFTGVGIYTYTLTETDNSVAGVTYLGNVVLKVTVVQNGNALQIAGIAIRPVADSTKTDADSKIDEFENLYKAGGLKVKKTVSGKMGDQSKKFPITVTFTAPTGKTVAGTITYTGDVTGTIAPGAWSKATETAASTASVTLNLSHNQEVQFDNIPENVTYTVIETDAIKHVETALTEPNNPNAYKVGGEVTKATAIATGSTTPVTVTNEKDITVDTGITLETLPYVLMMALAMMGLVALKLRKREEY